MGCFFDSVTWARLMRKVSAKTLLGCFYSKLRAWIFPKDHRLLSITELQFLCSIASVKVRPFHTCEIVFFHPLKRSSLAGPKNFFVVVKLNEMEFDAKLRKPIWLRRNFRNVFLLLTRYFANATVGQTINFRLEKGCVIRPQIHNEELYLDRCYLAINRFHFLQRRDSNPRPYCHWTWGGDVTTVPHLVVC